MIDSARAFLLVIVAFATSMSAATSADFSGITAARVGVDRGGTFWTWEPAAGRIILIAADGSRREGAGPGAADALDVDAAWGVASLEHSGDRLVVAPLSSGNSRTISLPNAASSVHWIDADHVVVATRFAAQMLEVWRISSASREKAFGASSAIDTHAPGARPARTMHLSYDEQHDSILAVDAFTGVVTAHARTTGALQRTVDVGSSRLAAALASIQGLDADYKRQGKPFLPSLWSYPTMAVASDGTVWLGESSTEHSAVLIAVRPNGAIARRTIEVPSCASIRVQVWREQFVFFRDVHAPLGPCFSAVKGELR
jgi:hypothetical protein